MIALVLIAVLAQDGGVNPFGLSSYGAIHVDTSYGATAVQTPPMPETADGGDLFIDDGLPIRYASMMLADGGTRVVDAPLLEDGGVDLEHCWTGMSPELTLHVAKAKAFGRAEDAALQQEQAAGPSKGILAGAAATTVGLIATGFLVGYVSAKGWPPKL